MWTPISGIELQSLLAEEKQKLGEHELAYFEKIEVPLEVAKIDRSGSIEEVFIVARFKDSVIFYEDVEEGFEISHIDESGLIKEYGVNQFELRHVVN